MVEDPRDAGRYTLPRTTLAAVKAAGMLQTVSLSAAASVGNGGEDGGHLTSDGVLARQQANVAKDIEGLHAGERISAHYLSLDSRRTARRHYFLSILNCVSF